MFLNSDELKKAGYYCTEKGTFGQLQPQHVFTEGSLTDLCQILLYNYI